MSDDFSSLFGGAAQKPVSPPPAPIAQPPVTAQEQAQPEEPKFKVTDNVEIYKDPTSPLSDEKLISEIVALPTMLRNDFLEAIEDLRQADIVTEADKRWFGLASMCSDTQPSVVDRADKKLDLFERALNATDRKWKQRLGELLSRPQSFKNATGVLEGRKALHYARSAANLGTYFTTLLPHTGGQVTFRSPSEGDLIHFMGRISDDLESLGRRTNGMFLSSEVGLLQQTYLEFALQHIDECTINYENHADLMSMLNIHDIQAMIWGVAGAIWSKGFQYRRSCIADQRACRHISEGMIDLRRLQWIDNNSIGDWQFKQVMAIRQKSAISKESLARYKKETPRLQDVTATIIENFDVTFTLCSAADYFASSSRWITTLEEKYVKAMDMTAAQRTSTLTDQAKASALRQYAHLVKSIRINECEIIDRESIEETLEGLSAHDEFRNNFFDKVNEFLDDSVISLIGIPAYTCPSCGKEQISPDAKKNVPGIIPVNVARLFFFLMPQKVMLIQRR